MTSPVVIDFCGEIYPVEERIVIGRDADVAIDDNPFLHRRFLEVSHERDMWWLSNVGSQLTATVSDELGAMQAWLAPGARMPLVFARTIVWFTAGPTTYELDILMDQAVFEPVPVEEPSGGELTTGRMALTPDQKLLIIALCEDVLRRGSRGAGAVPASNVAAKRLGWALTKFNRKLDNVCQKLAAVGVRGLHGDTDRLASSRKARLVEYAMAARLVTKEDLDLLP